MKYLNLIIARFFVWLIASIALVSCHSSVVDTPIEEEPDTTQVATVRFTVADGKSIHSGIESLVLCGSNYDGTIENAGDVLNNKGVFKIGQYEGRKSFFFVANLNAADREKVKATDPSKFNDIVLDILDYIDGYKTPITENYPLMPMVCMIKDITWDELNNTGEPWKLTRLFAVIHYKIVFPSSTSNFLLHSVRIMNYPSSFALAEPINNYDLTGYYKEDIYMDSPAELEGNIFIPEHYVSNPSFYDIESHDMSYLEISYTRTENPGGNFQNLSVGMRIGEYVAQNYRNYGQIVRGRVYNMEINIPDIRFATSSVLHFLN